MDSYSILWRIHAILMGASFIAMVTGYFIAAFGRKRTWWFKAHRALGTIGGFGALAALALAVIMISAARGLHLSNTHTILGIITIVFITLSLVLPAFFRRVKKEAKLPLRRIHKGSGVISISAMAASIVFGLSYIGIF